MTKSITVYTNQDKEYIKKDVWTKDRDLLDIPSYRAILVATPNSGKSNLIVNMVREGSFDKVFLLHPDPLSHDYDRIKSIIKLDSIPSLTDWDTLKDPEEKALLIIDDLEISLLSKDQLINLKRCYGYSASHKRLSVVIAYQSFRAIPIEIRKVVNLVVLWKIRNKSEITRIGSFLGFEKDEMKAMFNALHTQFDFLMFDFTPNTPAPIRLNGYEIYELE